MNSKNFRVKEPDEILQREIIFWIENNEAACKKAEPFYRNMVRHYKSGNFDYEKCIKLWEHYVNQCLRSEDLQLDLGFSYKLVDPIDRYEIAKHFCDLYLSKLEDNYTGQNTSGKNISSQNTFGQNTGTSLTAYSSTKYSELINPEDREYEEFLRKNFDKNKINATPTIDVTNEGDPIKYEDSYRRVVYDKSDNAVKVQEYSEEGDVVEKVEDKKAYLKYFRGKRFAHDVYDVSDLVDMCFSGNYAKVVQYLSTPEEAETAALLVQELGASEEAVELVYHLVRGN
ncbi:MAG: hypothetical protein ABIK31_00395 [candidate division WOR-3 bacterium]